MDGATGHGAGAPLRIVIVGHVDHGKSTLIGRLLHDTGALPDGKVAELEALAKTRGTALEWSFVLDAFQAERNQAVTIDTTQVAFRTLARDYVIVDAPGHREFLRNMISGAATCDAAVLVVDATLGIQEQTRRHGYLLHLLGVREIVAAVTKMDLVGFDRDRFAALERDIGAFFHGLGHAVRQVIPVVARDGDNLTAASPRLPWFAGPPLTDALDAIPTPPSRDALPLRLPVQDVYHFDGKRIIVGRLQSGTLRAGDELLFLPANRTARVRGIEGWGPNPPPAVARAGDSVGITLDDPLFLERGALACAPAMPAALTTVFAGRIFWLNPQPLRPGRTLTLKLATREVPVTVEAIRGAIDLETLGTGPAADVPQNGIADVVLRTREQVALDGHADQTPVSRFVLLDGFTVVGGGLASMAGYPDQRARSAKAPENLFPTKHTVTRADREARNGHSGGVLWLTGLSGAGKSTLAMAAERALYAHGYQVYVLDGDNVRSGLNADLGFSPEDRSENIRRVAEVAALFADAGLVVITAFISPYLADRERARTIIGPGFHEVYVKASLATCRTRDPKGLYAKAIAKTLDGFTGISAPYEEPSGSELTVDTERDTVDSCVRMLVDYVVAKLGR